VYIIYNYCFLESLTVIDRPAFKCSIRMYIGVLNSKLGSQSCARMCSSSAHSYSSLRATDSLLFSISNSRHHCYPVDHLILCPFFQCMYVVPWNVVTYVCCPKLEWHMWKNLSSRPHVFERFSILPFITIFRIQLSLIELFCSMAHHGNGMSIILLNATVSPRRRSTPRRLAPGTFRRRTKNCATVSSLQNRRERTHP